MSACGKCASRGWLLKELSRGLDRGWRDPEGMAGLLELDAEELIEAVGGKESRDLLASYSEVDQRTMRPRAGVEVVCRHDRHYPEVLAQAKGAPQMLHVTGGVARLGDLLKEPAVAIVGSRRATDYGMETARGMARGLAASGVTVVSAMAEGIPAAAHMGALEVNGPTVTVMPGGLDVCYPASRRVLYRRVQGKGCAVSELPCGCGARRWCHTARPRIVVGMARLVIVVEAEERPSALEPARLAEAMGRTVAAVPGRVSSPVSQGSHALLARGAHLVQGPQDALDALYGVGVKQAPATKIPLELRLREVLDQVGAGRDTLTKLTAEGAEAEEVILALAELELAGALVRGDGGRYLPRG